MPANRNQRPSKAIVSRCCLLLSAVSVIAAVVERRIVAAEPSQPGVVGSEFIYEDAPFKSCHASTIAETPTGLVAAWFGGPYEKHPDVGIWVARHVEGRWSDPVEVADGVQHTTKRYPCWNPVLFQPKSGPLMLFYKVGPDPRRWWGMLTTSSDGGKNWEQPRRLPEGIDGPVKNKPIQLSDGAILCGSSTENNGWRIHFERTDDLGRTWSRVGPINSGREFNAIQPSLLTYADGRMQILCRSRENHVTESWSDDGGRTWSDMAATSLPNPNSGTDAVTLKDGRQLLVYNHSNRKDRGREFLNVAVSNDGKTWQAALVLEDQSGEYSYPAVIQTSDGLVHTTYTYQRKKVKHVTIDPKQLDLREIRDGNWPE